MLLRHVLRSQSTLFGPHEIERDDHLLVGFNDDLIGDGLL